MLEAVNWTEQPWYEWALLWGALGGLAVQLLGFLQGQNAGPNRPTLTDFWFWIPFIVHPLLGGMLAFAHQISNAEVHVTPLLALNVGIAAPLIISQAAGQTNNSLLIEDDDLPPDA